MSVTERVIRVFAKDCGVEPQTITPNETFDELGMDSLDALSVAFSLEEEFDIVIPDAKMKDARTLADVIAFVDGLVTT